MAVQPSPWPNGGAMRYYLCPSCLHVSESHRHTAFDWCSCGQPLDAVALLTESVPLADHPSVNHDRRPGRFYGSSAEPSLAGWAAS
jgi:hypothetical protein